MFETKCQMREMQNCKTKREKVQRLIFYEIFWENGFDFEKIRDGVFAGRDFSKFAGWSLPKNRARGAGLAPGLKLSV